MYPVTSHLMSDVSCLLLSLSCFFFSCQSSPTCVIFFLSSLSCILYPFSCQLSLVSFLPVSPCLRSHIFSCVLSSDSPVVCHRLLAASLYLFYSFLSSSDSCLIYLSFCFFLSHAICDLWSLICDVVCLISHFSFLFSLCIYLSLSVFDVPPLNCFLCLPLSSIWVCLLSWLCWILNCNSETQA